LEQGLQIAIDPSASNREDMKAKGISTSLKKKPKKRSSQKKGADIIIPVDENSEEYKIWKKHVAILEKFIKRKTNIGLSIATSNFSEYFAMMRQRIGYWLFDVDNIEMLSERLESAKMNIDNKSKSFMLDEIKNENAMYFIQDRINRFVVRIAIRIHSTNISKVSMIQSKRIAAEAMDKVLSKQQENMTKMNSNPSSKKQTASAPNFIKPVFGHIIEPFVAYEQKVDPNDETCMYVNNGYAPYHQSKDKIPFSSSLCGRIDDFSYQEKPVETEFNSLYQRYKISEDAIMQESELFLKLNVPYWMNNKNIEKYAKQAVVCMFEPFGIDIGAVNVTNYYTVDNVDDDIFLPTGLMKPATTLTLTHKFDIKVDKLPYLLNNCVRTSWPSDISVHTAVENTQHIDSTSQVLDDENSKVLDHSQELSQSSLHDAPFRLHEGNKNKVIIGWKWREVNDNDYDVLVGRVNAKSEQWTNKLMELRTLMGWIWINCIQAKQIVECFSKNAVDGTSPIETAILIVFNRIVDLENFDIILSILPLSNKTSLLHRIGIFNVLNFTRINKINEIELDLRNLECRKLMKIIVELVNSGTISLHGEVFKESMKATRIKGWTLPDSWSSKIPEVGFIRTAFIINNESDPNVINKLKRYNKKYCLLAVPKLDGNDHHLLEIENNYDNHFT
jgi:hypothetical protein